MPTTIDSLQIEIQSNSTNAAQAIDGLAISLGNLKRNGTVSTAIKNLGSLSDKLSSFTDAANASRAIGKLSGAMERLKNVGSVASVGNSLTKLSDAIGSIGNVNLDGVDEKVKNITDAVSPLSNIKAGGLGTMVNALGKIGDVTASLDDSKISAFAERVSKLNEVLEPLSVKMTTVQAGLKGINSSARLAGASARDMGERLNTASINMASFIHNVQTAVRWVRTLAQKFSDLISDAIEWDGVSARFGRGFGPQAEKTYKWVQELNEKMGINTQQFMQYSSVYATMLSGFGVVQKDASEMALGYAELTYDIWAGYNDIYKTYADAADAVKSAIAGEVEPIRRAGFTIIESTLKQTAANHGLEISLANATEAQKSYLRYLTLVDQAHSQNLVGSYAREMNTAEGLVRTLSQQLKSLAQTVGSLLLPILARVLPYLQAFVELLTEGVIALASIFGIEIQGVDWSSYNSGVSDATDGTAGLGDSMKDAASAAKELQNATIGIDELNVISPPSGSGGGAGGAAGAFDGLDIDSLWDESIFDQIQFDVNEIVGEIKKALSLITACVSGFLLAIGTILLVSGANIPLGLGLMAVGAIGLASSIAANWGTMSTKLAKTLTTITSILGGFLLAIGAFLTFSGVNVPLGAALMVAGAVSLATAATINWKFLEGDLKNTLSNLTGIVSGGLLAMGALFAFTGVSVRLGIALMAAGAVGLVTSAALNWDSLSKPLRKAIGTLESIVGGGLLTFGAILALTGVNIPLGIGMIAAGAVSLASAVMLNWGSVTGDLRRAITTITALVSGALLGVGAILALTGVATPLGVSMMAAGAIGLVTSASINWGWVTNKIRAVLKEIGAAVGVALLAVGAILALTGVALPLGIALIAAGAASLIASAVLNWGSILRSVKDGLQKIGKAASEATLALGVILCLTGVAIPLGVALIAAGAAGLVTVGGSNWGSLLKKLKEEWGSITSWWTKNAKLSAPTIPSLSFKVTYQTDGLSKVKNAIVKALKLPGWPTLSFAANGGIFDMGSLVWAGERGAEIVANASGGKTGVMNVQQMQDAVYEGVYAAVVSAMRATGGSDGRSINVYLDGRQITAAVEKRQRERGASLMGNQVYSY